jgi:hypothetical protein
VVGTTKVLGHLGRCWRTEATLSSLGQASFQGGGGGMSAHCLTRRSHRRWRDEKHAHVERACATRHLRGQGDELSNSSWLWLKRSRRWGTNHDRNWLRPGHRLACI